MRIRKCTVIVFIMKLMVTLLLLAAVTNAAKPGSTKKHNESEKTEKRELVEGNDGIEKRAPLLSTVSPALSTGGVEYANTKEDLSDKSPAQQIYATPVPQIAKISDVLSGQGPQYQAAIDSHLYSPISVYQPRLGSPTTYEVSAPVPSQLAYSEHRLSLPSPNAIQYGSKQQNLGKPIINFQQPQILLRSSHEQNLGPVYPQYSNNIQAIPQPDQYSRQQVYPAQQFFIQPSQNSLQGISYQQNEPRDINSKSIHSQELAKSIVQQNAKSYASFTFNQSPSADQAQPKAVPSQQPQLQFQNIQQNEAQQFQPIAQINYQLQHPSLLLQQQPQPQQTSIQPLHTQIQVKQNQQLIQQAQQHNQYQSQPQIQYQLQPQIQYQAQPQINYQLQPQEQVQQIQYQQAQPQVVYQPQELQHSQQQPLQYQQPQPFIQYHAQQEQPLNYQQQSAPYQVDSQQYLYQQSQQYQPQYDISQIQSESKAAAQKPLFKQSFLQPQISQNQIAPQVQDNNKGIPALPTFPRVQYFGKYAHSLFGNYQH